MKNSTSLPILMTSFLVKCLFFISLLLISCSYASQRPFADTQDNVDLVTNEKFGMGLNLFHGSNQEKEPEPEAKPEDGGSDKWYQKASFGIFGGKGDAGSDKADFETNYLGSWKLDNPNVGVAAMQLQLLPNNKAIWFDTTALGPSALQMYQPPCPKSFENATIEDCFSHAIEYDTETAKVRPLKLQSDPWCSSGVLAPNGDLVVTGGYNKGIRAIRIIGQCPTCEFKEAINVTASDRWYPSNAILEDGSYIILGGRNVFDYEIVPPNTLQFEKQIFGLQFLSETTDKTPTGHPIENNLYPFIFLLPDGNALIFANNRSIIIEPRTAKLIRELPVLPGGSRNYPSTGSAVLLPFELTDNSGNIDVTMLVCGGNSHDAFILVDGVKDPQRFYAPALQDCGRIVVTKKDAQWEIEKMPSPRVLGDMFVLPNGEVLIINGAKRGTAGWEDADDANLTPTLYNPKKPAGNRFKELAPTTIPRMYHAAGCVLQDGKVLIAGSNPHSQYMFNVKYKTELRVEKFEPPYLDPALSNKRPVILDEGSDKKIKYGESFYIHIKLDVPTLDASILTVRMYAPPFTTHAFSMNQRQIVLKIEEVANNLIKTMSPPSGKIAPPGYYLIFVVHRGVPSKGLWVQISS